ncbi:MAG: hydrogenase maturation protease [Candidatus Omnitrophica bacterium]|nr:hydrogenase maturation protease [Candidatus Omnitrophota bacterium]
MPDLRQQLSKCLRGRVCLIGLGNEDWGDDGFGLKLARAIHTGSSANVFQGGTCPDRVLAKMVPGQYDHVVFLDAVDFGGAPGSVVLLDATEMSSRFPQISTHKISLGLLAKWVETGSTTKAWLLGVQPASLRPAAELSAEVRVTLEILENLLDEVLEAEPLKQAEELLGVS